MLPLLQTARLAIRPMRPDDLPGFAARRNDPRVARFQNWVLPFTAEQAEKMAAPSLRPGDPEDGQWRLAIVTDRGDGTVFGELALRLAWAGRAAEVGYSFAPEHWGRGYATEALQALVAHLFAQRRVVRVGGTLHPDNVASAQVLERTGFLFEGLTRLSYWVGDSCSDDAIYGMLRPDWEAWSRRPRHVPRQVRLVEPSPAAAGPLQGLRLHHTQEAYAGSPAQWFAEALLAAPPEVARLRAVDADGAVVGLVVTTTPAAGPPDPRLTRLVVDRLHQRRGIGARVLDLLAAECRDAGAAMLSTSWAEGRGSPGPFFQRHGFAPAGRSPDGRIEAQRRIG